MTIKKYFCFISTLALLFAFINQRAVACTELAINYKNQTIVGRNFDWPDKYAFLVINPIGIKRETQNSHIRGKQLSWTAKYGSITFNIADSTTKKLLLNSVMGGMNQYGLSASILWLQQSVYPKAPERPTIADNLWAQYFLDNAKTVKEAIKLASTIDVEPTVFHGQTVLLHLFLHDKTGDAAVMEYIHGQLKIYHGKNLPLDVLTNDTYTQSQTYLKTYQGFGGKIPLPGDYSSQARFVRAANFLKQIPKFNSLDQAIKYMFVALNGIAEPKTSPWPTVWSVVYNLSDKIIYFRNIDNSNIRSVQLNQINFATEKQMAQPINNSLSGDVTPFFSS